MKKIMLSEKKMRIKRLYDIYLDTRSKGKKYTVDHFMKEKKSKKTIYITKFNVLRTKMGTNKSKEMDVRYDP